MDSVSLRFRAQTLPSMRAHHRPASTTNQRRILPDVLLDEVEVQRVVERDPENQDAEHEPEIADAIREESFFAGVRRTGFLEPKTDEQVEKEFPTFLNQLKWTLITDKIVQDNAIQVAPDEIRAFAKQQLFSYMGGANLADDQP